jgi:hypothetical protein
MLGGNGLALIPTNVWNKLPIGNGGLVTRFDIAPDGTMVCAPDVAGAYLWSAQQNKWVQLVTTASMPAGTTALDVTTVAPYEIVIDHLNPFTLWMHWSGNLYKSIDKGTSWTLLSGFTSQPSYPDMANTVPTKGWGPYIAVDPYNSSVVYVGNPSRGLARTIDGGNNFTILTQFAAGLPGAIQNTDAAPSTGTGTSSVVVGTGNKTFSSLSFNPLSFNFPSTASTTTYVQVWRTSDPTVQMIGNFVSSSSTQFVINVDTAQGSGTFTDWTISQLQAIGGGHRIVFDTSGGAVTVSGQIRCANIFVHTYRVGTWKSTDGGVTFSAVSATNRPTAIRRMTCDPFGVLWLTNDHYSFSATNADKYDGTTWTRGLTLGGGALWYDQVVIDPTRVATKATTTVCYVEGNAFFTSISIDGGANFNQSGTITYASSGDVDWILPWYSAGNGFLGAFCAAFDPLNSGRLYFGGEGLWYCVPPAAGSGTAITITQQTRGIEEFGIVNITSPGGAASANSVIVGTWDFPLFYTNNFSKYPTAIGGAYGASQTQLMRGNGFDWVWNSPQTVVGLNQKETGPLGTNDEQSGYSFSGGVPGTWTKFATPPSTAPGGWIAASDKDTVLWVTTDGWSVPPKFTTNATGNPVTWSSISIPGGTPTTGWGPNSQGFAPASKGCESDKGNGDIYLYNWNDGTGNDQIYKWTKSSGLWSTVRHPALPNSTLNEIMKSVPGMPGHLFITSGIGGNPHPNPHSVSACYYTTDGFATTFTALTVASGNGFQEIISFGFGAVFPGFTDPTVFVAGWRTGTTTVNGSPVTLTSEYGIYMCKDFFTGSQTWIQCGGKYPGGYVGLVIDIDADKTIPGQVYIGTDYGCLWGRFS